MSISARAKKPQLWICPTGFWFAGLQLGLGTDNAPFDGLLFGALLLFTVFSLMGTVWSLTAGLAERRWPLLAYSIAAIVAGQYWSRPLIAEIGQRFA